MGEVGESGWERRMKGGADRRGNRINTSLFSVTDGKLINKISNLAHKGKMIFES